MPKARDDDWGDDAVLGYTNARDDEWRDRDRFWPSSVFSRLSSIRALKGDISPAINPTII
jgi:hypothetical protein